jgi:hypothetical protein
MTDQVVYLSSRIDAHGEAFAGAYAYALSWG